MQCVHRIIPKWCIIAIIIVSSVFVVFSVSNIVIKPISLPENIKIADSEDYVFFIDEVTVDEDNIYFSGWIYKKNVSTKRSEIRILLKDDDGKYYFIPTEIKHRPDVTEYFKAEKESVYGLYDWSGFTSKGKIRFSNLKHGEYDVYALCNFFSDEEELVSLSRRVKIGKE